MKKPARFVLAVVLCAGALLAPSTAAHASTCTKPVGDLDTGCVEHTACLVASKLGWACVE